MKDQKKKNVSDVENVETAKKKEKKKLNLDIKFDKKSIKAKFTSKVFKVGAYSTLASIIVIAIAIRAVILVGSLPTKYTNIDLTSNKLYTLSDQTEKLVSGLEDEVTLYQIVQSGYEDSTIVQLLERYSSLSKNINIVTIDPAVYPTFTEKYTTEDTYNNSIVVVCGDRSKYVSYYDIYVTDYSNYYTDGTTTTTFNGEDCLTSAIDYVTSETLPTVYTLTGHGESDLDSTLLDDIADENISVDSLNLITVDEIPQDYECIIINAPTTDISETEKDKLLTYLKAGGHMLLFTDYSDGDMPNLDEVMEYYGVSKIDGIVVEGDSSKYMRSYPHYILPDISSHTITDPLANNYYILMPIAEALTVSDSLRDTLTVTQLLTTSDSAYIKTNITDTTTTDKEEGDPTGKYAVGVAITETLENGNETDIVWFSTSAMENSNINQIVSGANYSLIINAIGWMCEHESAISIHSKSMDDTYLTVSSEASSRLSIILIGAIPLCFIVIGLYVWIRRKRV